MIDSLAHGVPSSASAAAAADNPAGAPTRTLQVLHVGKYYPPHMGGIETHLQVLCGELRKTLDARVIVASDDRTSTEEVIDGVPVSRAATPFTLASAPLCPRMVTAIRRSHADIVHLHLPNPSAILAYLASGHRGRLVVSYHSDTVRQRILGAAFEPLLHAALRRSSAIIASSPENQRTSNVLSRYQDRCHVIPYGIPIEQFERPDAAAVDGIRKQFGERLILAVGRLVYYKGFEHLIHAMTQVDGKLVIVGDGPLRAKLLALITSLGIENKVVLAGKIPDEIAPYYHAADVFVLPSIARSEAFGIVQVEAMASGLPVVNTSLESGVPFVSLHEQTGLTVPPADSQALAQAINRLLADPHLRQSLGQAARLRARQEFSAPIMTSRMLALYDAVMQSGRT